MLQVSSLASGLKVATYYRESPLVAVVLGVGVGRRHESAEEIGFSHFLEHMLCTGTVSYPSPKLVDDSVKSLGGYTNAHTGAEWVWFDHEILAEHLDQALKTLSEQIQSSLLLPEEISRQQQIIRHEFEKYIDDCVKYSYSLSSELLWPGQPISDSYQRQIDNLPNITRQKLTEYMSRHYTAGNMCLMLVGPVSHELALEKAAQLFSGLPDGINAGKPEPIVSIPGVALATLPEKNRQLRLRISFYAPGSRDEGSHATEILARIMGDRLTESLRYRHSLTYGVQCGFAEDLDTGCLYVSGSFDLGRAEDVLNLIKQEIDRATSKPASAREMAQAKNWIKSGLVRGEESVSYLARRYAYRVLFDFQPLLLTDDLTKTLAVTPRDVWQAAQAVLTDTFKVVAIGPKEDVRVVNKILNPVREEDASLVPI